MSVKERPGGRPMHRRLVDPAEGGAVAGKGPGVDRQEAVLLANEMQDRHVAERAPEGVAAEEGPDHEATGPGEGGNRGVAPRRGGRPSRDPVRPEKSGKKLTCIDPESHGQEGRERGIAAEAPGQDAK